MTSLAWSVPFSESGRALAQACSRRKYLVSN
jgi:hypothetical protein